MNLKEEILKIIDDQIKSHEDAKGYSGKGDDFENGFLQGMGFIKLLILDVEIED